MKNIPIIVAVFCITSGTIYAGPPQVAESKAMTAAAAPFTWTGFYLGVQGGYTHAQVDPQLSLGGSFSQIPAPITDGLESRGSQGFDYDGGTLGGLAGFNYQFGQMVVGLEGSGSYLWSRDSRDTGAFLLGQGVPPLEIRGSFKTHYLFTVGPRIGYAFGRALPYITGGLAVGDLEWSQELHDLADPSTRLGRRITQTNAGWMVGGGVEYALTNNWHARVQYEYADLGSAEFDSFVTTSPPMTSHHTVGFTEHNASFALIYKF
jgi:outer membrane immunogenic protein